jgi:hypothetical protein
MLPDMESYQKILQDYGRTVVPCEEFSHIENFDSHKPMIIGEENGERVSENGERVDCIVSVLQIEPRSMRNHRKYGQRDKSNDIKLCEIRLGKNFNIDNMTVQLTQCCDDDKNANFIYDEPPNQVPCTHIIIWVTDKRGVYPYETFTILDGPDIEATYDPAALLQWEYNAADESVTVSQFQTAENMEKTKEKLQSLVRSAHKDMENFQNNVPNEDLPDNMDEKFRTLYMQELLDKKTIYEKRLLEYEEQHHHRPRKIILKKMKCSEAFRFSRDIPLGSDITPTGFLLWKHCDMIAVYTCKYISGWNYDVMREDASTFIKGMTSAHRIADLGTNSEELKTMYSVAMKTIKQEQENARAEARRKTVMQLRSVDECEKMFMKCVELPSFDIYPRHATTFEERKFFDDAVTVYGSLNRIRDDARRVMKRFEEPHKQFVISYNPMGESDKSRLYESMRTALQSMQTAMQANIVKSLKTFEYGGRTYDLESILNRLLEYVEEEIKPHRDASRKRPHDDSVGGVGGLGAPLTSVSNLLLSLNSLNL